VYVLSLPGLRRALAIGRQDGQTQAEYGVVLAVIAVASVGAFTVLSGGIANAINRVIGFLPS
jgi:Flp pilus assembly pilin Flp